jgi:tetratricopeptide (TPR) repeat protein
MTPLDEARVLLSNGRAAEAVGVLQGLRTRNASCWETNLLLGLTLVKLKRSVEAKEAFKSALDAQPSCFEAILWLARVHRDLGESSRAIETAQDMVALHPVRWEGFAALGDCYMEVGVGQECLTAYTTAVLLAPREVSLRHGLAQCFLFLGRRAEAEEEFRKAVELDQSSPRSYLALGSYYCRFGLIGKGLDVLTEGLSRLPNNPALHSAAASAYALIRNDVAAEKHHLRATALSKQALVPYAVWLSDQGRNDEALTIYQRLIDEFPRLGAAYYGIVQVSQGSDIDETLVTKMEVLLREGQIDPTSRMYLNYALAKTMEKRRDYEKAMSLYDEANLLAFNAQRLTAPFDLDRVKDEFTRSTKRYQELAAGSVWGSSDSAPIFIVGMIRSGTTLLDQIVSSHPMVSNAGELRFWIEKSLWLAYLEPTPPASVLEQLGEEYLEYVSLLVGSSNRTTDKMPLNFFSIGLIQRTLPKARFIHIRRNPVDTCLSIYTTYFGQGSHFVYNKANTVAYYRLYLEAMAYWRAHLPPESLMEVDYEDLISNPEPTIRQIVDFCGLTWDDACLHHEKNESAINTPSRWQARQPIYKSSLERWRNYVPWLGDFTQLIPNPESVR